MEEKKIAQEHANAAQQERPRENKMGTMPVKKLLISMALPMMISMLVQALYNVVDSIFVARIEEDALTAVTLAFPLQNLMIAVGGGIGVGVNALLSRSLGEKRFDQANDAANTGLFLTFFHYILFLLIAIFAARPFIRSQTADPRIMEYGVTYLTIVCGASIGLFYQMMFERLLQSTGLTVYSMISQGTGAIINIIMDPIMIFGLFGFPRLGVAGAAWATVLGQCVAAILGLVLNVKRNREITISLKEILHPNFANIRNIYAIGIPSCLMMAIGSFMSYMMNRILITFSTTATAVFGAYFKLQSFFFMPVFGLNNGVVPVIAYNYGAQNKARIKEALRFSVTLAVVIMTVGTLVFQLMPHTLLKMFNASEDMMALGVRALHIISISFPASAVAIGLASVYQAFSRSYYSLILSVARQIVILIPAAYLLARTGVVENVWWAFTIAEVSAAIMSLIIYRRIRRTVISPMPDVPPEFN